MIREVGDPIPALEGALECLLLKYQYVAEEGTLELITDYWKAPGADRIFLRVLFGNVSDFERITGTSLILPSFKESYWARDHRAAHVVQSVEIDRGAHPMRVFLGFGIDFGGIAFSCASISAHTRNTLATKRKNENEWDYRDADDNTPLDFYDPFADPLG